MRWKRTLTMVEAHCEGEAGRVVTEGLPDVPGNTMLERMDHLNGPGDDLRRFCVFEPRGHAAMSTILLLPPCREDADAAFVILQADRAHSMSGSNAICVVTVLLETGIVGMSEPTAVVRLDTPAGLVTATAICRGGKCESVSLRMTPCFAERLDVSVDVPGLGEVTIDLAFGGLYYALVDAAQLGIEIEPGSARRLVEAGSAVHRACNAAVELEHPEHSSLSHLAYVMFTGRNNDGELVNATILPPGRVDRSPCGTGSSARLAAMLERGEAKAGETHVARSIIGGRFEVRAADKATVAGRGAIVPEVSGRAWIHGEHRIGVDPDDPHQLGFCLSDTWGDALDLIKG